MIISSARAATRKYRLSVSNSRNLFCYSFGAGCPRSSVGRVGFWWKCSLDLYLALISLHPHLTARFLLYVERQWWLASSSSKGWALIFHLLDMTTPVPYSLHSSLGLCPLMEVLLLPDPTVSGCQSNHLMPGQPTIILKSEHSWLCITDTEAIILKLACIRELNCLLSKAVGLGKGIRDINLHILKKLPWFRASIQHEKNVKRPFLWN